MFSGTIKGVALGPLVQDSSSLAAHRLSRRLYNIHITFPLQRPRFFFFRTTKDLTTHFATTRALEGSLLLLLHRPLRWRRRVLLPLVDGRSEQFSGRVESIQGMAVERVWGNKSTSFPQKPTGTHNLWLFRIIPALQRFIIQKKKPHAAQSWGTFTHR